MARVVVTDGKRHREAHADDALVQLSESGAPMHPEDRILVPMGEVSYFSLTGTVVAIAAASDGLTNFVKAAPVSVLTAESYEFDNGGANNARLRYTGAVTKMFHCASTLSFGGGAGDTLALAIAKNGAVIPESRAIMQMAPGGDPRSTALHQMVELGTNDYIELWVANITDASDPTVYTMNLFAMGM